MSEPDVVKATSEASAGMLLMACAQCGAHGVWIERVQTFSGYSNITIAFTQLGDVDAISESVAEVEWDGGDTTVIRCSKCLAPLGKAQWDAVEVALS
jgi:hypothetical protein